MNLPRSPDGTGFGQVIVDELTGKRAMRSQMLVGVAGIGVTICNDGAEWRKRSLVKSE
jgi:hypothetical protein